MLSRPHTKEVVSLDARGRWVFAEYLITGHGEVPRGGVHGVRGLRYLFPEVKFRSSKAESVPGQA